MKTFIELMIVGNLMLFILNSMFAGVSVAQEMYGAFWFFAIASLVHGVVADAFKKLKQKRYPSETEKS